MRTERCGATRTLPRPAHATAVIEKVHRQVDPSRLYAVNGLQVLPINTLYQLAAEPDLQHARRLLLIPDLLGYWLTGRETAEETNASTTGLLDARTGHWARELVEALGLPAGLLPEVVAAGQVLAPLSPTRARGAGHDQEPLVTTVGSHDTASAVVGVPGRRPELRLHLLRDVGARRRRAGRARADRGQQAGQLHQRARRRRHHPLPAQRHGAVAAVGVDPELEPARARRSTCGDLLARPPHCRPGPADRPGRPGLPAAGRHAGAASSRACREAGERVPEGPAEVVRCILDNLAAAFAAAIDQAERLSGQPVEVVHIVGGGSRNALLCQLTADAAGGRWSRARSRRRRWATCWCRRGRTGWCRATWPPCGSGSEHRDADPVRAAHRLIAPAAGARAAVRECSMVALLHSDRSKATMLRTAPRPRSGGAIGPTCRAPDRSHVPPSPAPGRPPPWRARPGVPSTRASPGSRPRRPRCRSASDWLSQRVCRTTATRNAPTNRRICRRPGVAAAAYSAAAAMPVHAMCPAGLRNPAAAGCRRCR